MPRRKKKIEDDPTFSLVTEEMVEEVTETPTEEPPAPDTCSQGYDFEVPNDVCSLLVDGLTLVGMFSGAFRPYQKYDQVVYQAENNLYFSLYLAFRAVIGSAIANDYLERQISANTPRSYPGGKSETAPTRWRGLHPGSFGITHAPTAKPSAILGNGRNRKPAGPTAAAKPP